METTMTPAKPQPTTVIEPSRGWASLGLRDVWEYRELLYFLVWREVKGRYRQMAFGPLWIILAPLIQMFIYSVIFGSLAKLPSEGVPYPIFTYVALLPWQFFANATRQSSNSLLSQKHVIAKVYFPRMVIPLAAVLSSLVDFLADDVALSCVADLEPPVPAAFPTAGRRDCAGHRPLAGGAGGEVPRCRHRPGFRY
jgi:lipopolysaccharide transport system permease protein